ncbi:hypothetical protein E2562_033613 [Oryza meyeriana var. granulata]|uniref:Uncharacterized protein n=1 Tax=Oryza meyeriana var. granulata TaxID=110450 RepID=A0A6G1FEW7_9ORYZ|nr:hypothetical protein E2562_033613 [Oryza meyeriana var. granulata]
MVDDQQHLPVSPQGSGFSTWYKVRGPWKLAESSRKQMQDGQGYRKLSTAMEQHRPRKIVQLIRAREVSFFQEARCTRPRKLETSIAMVPFSSVQTKLTTMSSSPRDCTSCRHCPHVASHLRIGGVQQSTPGRQNTTLDWPDTRAAA